MDAKRSEKRSDLLARLRFTGKKVQSLMRVHHVTLHELARRQRVTLKRVREVRAKGVAGFMADEYHFAITGRWWTDAVIDGHAE